MIRLDKYLADSLGETRSRVKEYIRAGRIFVDGLPEKDPGRKVDPDRSQVRLDEKAVGDKRPRFLMLHKPAGFVTAVSDRKLPTVMDLVDPSLTGRKGMFPVGRLDRDTEGLLLLTDDGEAAHRLLSPAHHVAKTYQAVLAGHVGEKERSAFEGGLEIGDDKRTGPARLQVLEQRRDVCFVEIELTEGRFHQVKRMAQAIGCPVLYLRRVGMGALSLDLTLKKGEVRALTPWEETILG